MNKYALITLLSLLPGMPIHAATLAVFVNDADGKPLADTVVDVPGDHFTMLGEHAATTARAVDDWLRAALAADRDGDDV